MGLHAAGCTAASAGAARLGPAPKLLSPSAWLAAACARAFGASHRSLRPLCAFTDGVLLPLLAVPRVPFVPLVLPGGGGGGGAFTLGVMERLVLRLPLGAGLLTVMVGGGEEPVGDEEVLPEVATVMVVPLGVAGMAGSAPGAGQVPEPARCTYTLYLHISVPAACDAMPCAACRNEPHH